MKIVHLCAGFPITYNGGITNYVRNIAETQIEKGYEVVVIGSKDPQKNNLRYKYIEYNDFFIRPFTLKERKSFFGYKKIKRILKNENPDLLHIHMMLDVDVRLYEILDELKIKYVVSLHDYSYLCPKIQMFTDDMICKKIGDKCEKCAYFLEQSFFLKKICDILKINKKIGKKNSPNFLKMYHANKKMLENAEILLPVSNRVKEIYEESGINNRYKVLYIGNLTANKFKKYKRKKYIDNKKIKVVMLGHFSHIKGGDEYIKIAQAMKNEQFEFYFLGRNKYLGKKEMEDNNIIDLGKYKQVELPNILKEYDLGCVLPIWEDNAPQVVMELLNNNIPVVATKMGGIPDFIIDGKNGFLYNPYSKEDFKKLINRLKKLTLNECEKMKENINKTLTPEEHFSELEEEYEKIIL